MSWITAEDYANAEPDPLAPAAKDILTHMNEDHADAVKLYASVTAKVAHVSSAVITAVDRYGFDLAVTTTDGKRAVRLAFDAPVTTTDEVRKAMVAMVKAARSAST
jgi:putative heme iron utilization protein